MACPPPSSQARSAPAMLLWVKGVPLEKVGEAWSQPPVHLNERTRLAVGKPNAGASVGPSALLESAAAEAKRAIEVTVPSQAQTPPTQLEPAPQSLEKRHALPSPQAGQLVPPQSTSVSVPSFTPLGQESAEQILPVQ